MSNTTKGLTLKHKIGYGAGDAGGVVTLYMISGYMTLYLTNILKVDTAVLASMLLIWNIWDAVNDPMMGTLMDMAFAKSKNKKNKFRPWILASIPVLIFGLIAFYVIPVRLGGGFPMIASVFVLKIVYEAGYTMMNIGMGSLLGVMSTNDNERAGLSSARGFGATIGGLIGGMVIPLILKNVGQNETGFMVAAIACAILGGFIVYIHYAWTEERNVSAQSATAEDSEAEKVKFTDILQVFKKNRAYLALCLHSIAICFAQGIQQQASAFMYTSVLGDIGLQSIASPISTVLMIVALSAAPKLAKKMDLVKIIRMSLLGGIVSYGVLYVLMITTGLNNIVFVVWSSISTALVTLSVQMQWGLVGEAIDYNEYLTGKRTEGSIYGTFSLTRRIGQTLAASLAVLMLGWIGYDGGAAVQSAGAIKGLISMNLLAPAVGGLLSFLSFTFIWNINSDVRAKMTAWKKTA